MKILLLLPLLLGFSVPAIAHNEANGGCSTHCDRNGGEGEGAEPEMGLNRYSLPPAVENRDF